MSGDDYLAEFAALNAAGRDSSWKAVAAESALVVSARIILGEYLDNATSADKLVRARSERLKLVDGRVSHSNDQGHLVVVDSSRRKATMATFHFEHLKLVCARSARPHRTAKDTRSHSVSDSSSADVVAAAPPAREATPPLAIAQNEPPLSLGCLGHAKREFVTAQDVSGRFKGLCLGRLFVGCGAKVMRSIAVAVAALVPELFPLELSRIFLDSVGFLKDLARMNGISVSRQHTEQALVAALGQRGFTTTAVLLASDDVPTLISSLKQDGRVAFTRALRARVRETHKEVVAAAETLLGATGRSIPVDQLHAAILRLKQSGHGTFKRLGTHGDVDESSSVYTAVAAKRTAFDGSGSGGQCVGTAILIIKSSEAKALIKARDHSAARLAKQRRAVHTGHYLEAVISMDIHGVQECIVVSTTY